MQVYRWSQWWEQFSNTTFVDFVDAWVFFSEGAVLCCGTFALYVNWVIRCLHWLAGRVRGETARSLGPHSRGLRADNPEFCNNAKVRFSRDMAGTRAKENPGPWITPIYLLVGTSCLAEVRRNPQRNTVHGCRLKQGTAEFRHFSQNSFF